MYKVLSLLGPIFNYLLLPLFNLFRGRHCHFSILGKFVVFACLRRKDLHSVEVDLRHFLAKQDKDCAADEHGQDPTTIHTGDD